MLEIEIPGYRTLRLQYLVLDYNGTLACSGRLIEGVEDRLVDLSRSLEIHLLTADTFGTVRSALQGVKIHLSILPSGGQAEGKREYVHRLGREEVVCVGNGRNDRLMLEAAALGIAVVLEEGTALDAIRSSDLICRGIQDALDLLRTPRRLVATLRS